MAPERFAGLDSPAADVYSLGVLALEMLSGQSVIANAVKLRPRALRDALASALDPDPRARPASAGELAFRLRRANQLWRRQLAAVAVSLTLLASLLGYIMFHRQARARQVRESVWNKEFALALGGLDALGPAQQGRQFLGLWRFVNSETNDPEKLESAAEILILVGMQYGHPGHRHLGQSATAESTLQKARRMADKAMALAPTRWHAKKLAAQSRDALGSVLIEMGRYQEAEQILLDGLRISEGEPRVVGIRAGLFGSLSRIAFHHRDWPRCLQFRNQLVETRRQLWAANQPAIGFAVDYAGALAARGYLFREMADYPAASRDYAESDRVLGHGIVMSPDNQQVAWQLARNSLEVGRTLLLAGDVNAACLRLEKACERLRQFHRDDSMDQATVRELALSLAWLGKARKQARLAARSWQPPLAEAVRLATAAAQHDPASAKAADNLAAIQSIAGELQLARMSGESRNRSGRRSIGLPPPTAAVAEPKTN